MLRVSSRQRLVSWDAFDASAPEEDPDDQDVIMLGPGSSNANASANIVVDALSGALAVHNDGSNNDDVVVGNVNNNGDDDEDADSIADYESCCYDSTSRRGSAVSSGGVPPVPPSTGWSFDLDGTADAADSSAFPPPPPSPSSVAVVVGKKRDRDYEQSSSSNATTTTTTTTTSVGGGGMKKTVSFSTLPPFPILEVPPHHQETTSSGSFLPTLIVPPSPSSSPISAGRSKIVIASSTNNVPIQDANNHQMGVGRVSSDVSLCRYLSVQSLCDMASFSSYVPSPTSSSSPPHLVNLVDDALYSVASHLDPCDVRSLSATCRELRTLLTDRGAGHLWLGLGSRRWPVVRALTDQGKDDGNKRIEFRDGLGVPIAGCSMVANNADTKSSPTNDDATSDSFSSDRHDDGGGGEGGSFVVNMSALVGLTAPSQPTEIRPQSRTTLPSAASSSRRTRAAFRAGHHADYFRRFEMVTTTTGGRGGDSQAAARARASRAAAQVRPVVQYTGRVGDGDRSLTADDPLPRPTTVAPVADPVIITPPSDSEGNSSGSSSSTRSGSSRSRTSSSSVLPIPKKWSPRLSPLPSFHGGLGGPSPASLIDLLRRRRSSSSSVGGGLSRSSSSVSTQGGNGEEESSGGGGSTTTTTKRPFVSPFVVEEREDGHGQQQQPVVVVDVTPRLVSYYEVTVLPRDVGQEPPLVGGNEEENGNGTARGTAAAAAASRHQRRRQQPGRGVLGGPEMPPLRLPAAAAAGAAAAAPGFPLPNPHHLPHPRIDGDGDGNTDPSDCVAVGLSTSSFAPAAKMPGWDGHSYGYHGDDGGTFHGAGDMERVFGPTYGVGDTVGCGVDYAYNDGRGAIFFTLNGKFLGYAWTDVPAVRDGEELYPTVGVDTNCPLSVNFGDVPFEFDLAGFADGQREVVEGRLGSGLVRRRAEERRRREEEEAAAAAAATAAGKATAVELTPSTVEDVLDSRKIDEWGRGITSPPLSSVRGGVGVGGASVGAMRRTRTFRGMS